MKSSLISFSLYFCHNEYMHLLTICMSALLSLSLSFNTLFILKAEPNSLDSIESIYCEDDLKEESLHFNTLLKSKLHKNPLKSEDHQKKADLVLELTDSKIPAQGYLIKNEDHQIHIQASDDAGIYYGCNELIKRMMLHQNIPAEEIKSSPECKERGVLIDCGRKYYSPKDFYALIDTMAFSNLNCLVLHFSENSGYRLESKLYPWLAGSDIRLSRFPNQKDPDAGKYLSQKEMADIIAYAAKNHVEVIPSMDIPGHLAYVLKKAKEEGLGDFRARYNYGEDKGEYIKGTLDLTNEKGADFIYSLLKEIAQFFYDQGCRTFDMGGDELIGGGQTYIGNNRYIKWQALDNWKTLIKQTTNQEYASAYDLFILFMNEESRYLKEMGYTTTRMWNDELYRFHTTKWNQVVKPDPEIQIEYWNADGGLFINSPRLYTGYGHKLINATNFYNYYILDPKLRYLGVFPDAIYREYVPNFFLTTWTKKKDVAATYFCVWADNPVYESTQEILDHIDKLLFFNALKVWNPHINSQFSYKYMEDVYTDLKKGV